MQRWVRVYRGLDRFSIAAVSPIPLTEVGSGLLFASSVSTVNTIGGFYNTWHMDTTTTPFKSVGIPGFGGYGTNNNQSRALQMLHELGHVIVTGLNPDGTPKLKLPLDGKSTTLSTQNTDSVKAQCQDLINTRSQTRKTTDDEWHGMSPDFERKGDKGGGYKWELLPRMVGLRLSSLI